MVQTSYVSNGRQIVIGSKSDTPQARKNVSAVVSNDAPDKTFTFTHKSGAVITRDIKYIDTPTTKKQIREGQEVQAKKEESEVVSQRSRLVGVQDASKGESRAVNQMDTLMYGNQQPQSFLVQEQGQSNPNYLQEQAQKGNTVLITEVENLNKEGRVVSTQQQYKEIIPITPKKKEIKSSEVIVPEAKRTGKTETIDLSKPKEVYQSEITKAGGTINYLKQTGKELGRQGEFIISAVPKATYQISVLAPSYLISGKPKKALESVSTPEVLTAGTIGAFAIGGEFFPVITKGVFYGLTTISVAKAVSKPSPENVASASLMSIPIGIEKSPVKVKYREIIIPNEVNDVNIKALGLETKGGRAIVLGAKTPEGLSIGSPNIIKYLDEIPSNKEIRISNPTETKILQNNIQNIPVEQLVNAERVKEFIPTTQAIIRKTQRTQPSISNFPLETERMNPIETKTVLDFVKEEGKKTEIVISGSYSRGAQLSKTFEIQGEMFNLNKVPRDIDIHFTKASPEIIGNKANELLFKLKNTGGDFRLVGEGGIVKNSIEKLQPSGKYEKVTEFLGEGTIPIEESVPDMVVGINKAEKPIKIEGIQATRLREELRGVIQGTARFRKTESGFDIFPPEKRVKDIGSVSVTARSLYQVQLIKRPFLLKNIEKFESFYPKELVGEQVVKVEIGKVSPSNSFRNSEVFNNKKIIGFKESSTSNFNKESSDFSLFSKSSQSSLASSSSKSVSASSFPSVSSKASPSVSPSVSASSFPSVSSKASPSVSPRSSFSKSSSPSPSPSPSFFTPSVSQSPFFSLSSSSSKKKDKYHVVVGRKGKTKYFFEKKGLSLSEASDFLKSKLRGTASASGNVFSDAGEKVSIADYDLYTSKKGATVQRNKFRISSFGEKQQITFAPRKNKTWGF